MVAMQSSRFEVQVKSGGSIAVAVEVEGLDDFQRHAI